MSLKYSGGCNIEVLICTVYAAHGFARSMYAGECCRISPPRFLVKCRKRQLGSFVLLCFALFVLSGFCLVILLSLFLICLLSCIFQHEPT